MSKRINKWIGKTGVARHKGKLHRKLGYGKGERIPTGVLVRHAKGNSTEAHEARFAFLARGHYGKKFKHHGHRKAHHVHHGR